MGQKESRNYWEKKVNESTGDGADSTMADQSGIRDSWNRTFNWDNFNKTNSPTPLADHAAVLNYRKPGISTDDLSSFIESFASLRVSRVKQIGASQYELGVGQKFETFSVQDTVKELVEELADASNYIDFLAIKLLSIVSELESKEMDCG